MKIVVFLEADFPFIDTAAVSREDLAEGLIGHDVHFADASALREALSREPDLFIHAHGSAFPKPCWTVFLQYLRAGGQWLNLGGNPLSRPVRPENGEWKPESSQRQYPRAAGINQAYEVPVEGLAWQWQFDGPDPGDARLSRAWALQVKLAGETLHSDECGAQGAVTGRVQSLLYGRSKDRILAAPVVRIIRSAGEFAGGRWLLVNAHLQPGAAASLLPHLIRAAADAPAEALPAALPPADPQPLASGAPLSIHGDYFHRDGRPYLVTGTTYMCSVSHRRFLMEPHPEVWDQDFARMRAAGVNIVRTGIWTGWYEMCPQPGQLRPEVLDAFEAWLLAARRQDLPVIFTFFAFLPPTWGAENPFLDPAAVSAQQAFIRAFSERFRGCNTLLWDFINEPSFCNPDQLWDCRPNYDRFEQQAWQEWLLQQASGDEWRERWRMTPDEPLDLPPLKEFRAGNTRKGMHPLRTMTYRLFAQEMFRRWTRQMAEVIRENGNPHQLITVGQDEGGCGERPAPHFHGDEVDFTSNHSWWNNGALLWDTLFGKLPGKPHLIEETGIMYADHLAGDPWYSPTVSRNLLEQKMALSFAGGGAGFIQWLWNTNIYLRDDSEPGIGFLRADGTEKPELEAFRGIARFMRENSHRMIGREPEEAVIIIPHSNLFSATSTAENSTRRAVQVLQHELGIPCRMVSEYRPQDIGDARLIVLPSPRILTETCWQALLERVRGGASAAVTGYLEADEYWRPLDRMASLGLEVSLQPVAEVEMVSTGAGVLKETFPQADRRRLEKAVLDDQQHSSFHQIPYGAGSILYCGLPLELAAGETVVHLYRAAARTAGLPVRAHEDLPTPLLETRVRFARETLSVFVHEGGSALDADPAQHQLRIPPGRIGLTFADNSTGEEVATYQVE